MCVCLQPTVNLARQDVNKSAAGCSTEEFLLNAWMQPQAWEQAPHGVISKLVAMRTATQKLVVETGFERLGTS